MLRQQARLIAAGIFLVDLALVSGAFFLAFWLRGSFLPRLGVEGFAGRFYPLDAYLPLLPVVLAIWSVFLLSSGRYRSHRTVPLFAEAWAILRIAGLAAVTFALVLYAFRLDEKLLHDDKVSRAWILLFAVFSGLFVLAEKLALRLAARRVRASGFNFRTVLFVGANAQAFALADAIRSHRYWGYQVVGFLATEEPAPESTERYPILGRLADLHHTVAAHVVDEVVFAGSRRELDRLEDIFLELQDQGIITRYALHFFPHTQAHMTLEELDGVPLVTFSTSPTAPLALLGKRLVDLALSAIVLVLALPVIGAIGVTIGLSSKGGVLFRQRRCGQNGRIFTLYKFRTMVEDAEARRAEVEHLNEMDGPVFKAKHDPRVTRIGRFLRKFSLDELPQLWNVLRGDMSLVGPRPPIPEEVARYERWQRRRLAMKPGLTCLWQVSGRNAVDFDQWMKLDLDYIDHWSPWLDLKILAKTIPVVLSGRGAS